MFDFESTHGASLNEAITRILDSMKTQEASSKEYSATVDNLVNLAKIKNEAAKLEFDSGIEEDKLRNETEKIALDAEKLKFEQNKQNSWRPSPDAIVAVVGTLATAILVLNYEKLGVITSKAFAFIGKTVK